MSPPNNPPTESRHGIATFRLPVTTGVRSRWSFVLLLFLVLTIAARADFTYTTSGGNATITGYTGTPPADLTIPATLGGNTVTAIASDAFINNTVITSVTFAPPSSVTTIGEGAFFGCGSLASVMIPTSVSVIGSGAFYYCVSLTGVTISAGVTSVGVCAFVDCTSLTSLTFPASVTDIGDGAFEGCTKLASISVDGSNPDYSSVGGVLFDKNQTTLVAYPAGNAVTSYTVPSSVTAIGNYAFYLCAKLGSVTLPAGVTSIGDFGFFACSGLTGIAIPASVTSIGNQTFANCGKLTSVTIPTSVTSIGFYAFAYCASLTAATFQGNAPTMGSSVFSNAASGFMVYYQRGAAGFSSPTWTDSSGDSYSATGTFTTPQAGSLQVTITPAGAVSAGAQWQVDGGAWQNSGATVAALGVAVSRFGIPESSHPSPGAPA